MQPKKIKSNNTLLSLLFLDFIYQIYYVLSFTFIINSVKDHFINSDTHDSTFLGYITDYQMIIYILLYVIFAIFHAVSTLNKADNIKIINSVSLINIIALLILAIITLQNLPQLIILPLLLFISTYFIYKCHIIKALRNTNLISNSYASLFLTIIALVSIMINEEFYFTITNHLQYYILTDYIIVFAIVTFTTLLLNYIIIKFHKQKYSFNLNLKHLINPLATLQQTLSFIANIPSVLRMIGLVFMTFILYVSYMFVQSKVSYLTQYFNTTVQYYLIQIEIYVITLSIIIFKVFIEDSIHSKRWIKQTSIASVLVLTLLYLNLFFISFQSSLIHLFTIESFAYLISVFSTRTLFILLLIYTISNLIDSRNEDDFQAKLSAFLIATVLLYPLTNHILLYLYQIIIL